MTDTSDYRGVPQYSRAVPVFPSLMHDSSSSNLGPSECMFWRSDDGLLVSPSKELTYLSRNSTPTSIQVSVSSPDQDHVQHSPSASDLAAPVKAKARNRYSAEDDSALENFVARCSGFKIGGNLVWKEAARQEVTQHTWQSMRDRYLKRILPRMKIRQARSMKEMQVLPSEPPVVPPPPQQRHARYKATAMLQPRPAAAVLPVPASPEYGPPCSLCDKSPVQFDELHGMSIGCPACRNSLHPLCFLQSWLSSSVCPSCHSEVVSPSQWTQRLLDAIRAADLQRVEEVVQFGTPNLYFRSAMGLTFLHYAACMGADSIILFLSERMHWARLAHDAGGRTPADIYHGDSQQVLSALRSRHDDASHFSSLPPLIDATAPEIVAHHGLRGLAYLIWYDLPKLKKLNVTEQLLEFAIDQDSTEMVALLAALGQPMTSFRPPCCEFCVRGRKSPLDIALALSKVRVAEFLRSFHCHSGPS